MERTIRFSLFVGMLLISSLALAQPPTGPFIISPQVHVDRQITFSYLDPKAREVKLSGQFLKTEVPLRKDSAGIWTVRVGPVEADIYPYSFIVDGINVMDPANADFFPNERYKASLVYVPGDKPQDYAVKNVPHGTVAYRYYPSVEGSTGTVLVYTPPGYAGNSSKKYPVFYLTSGTTDTEETFFKVGRINFILDNLIAEGKAKPMIVVMPYGNPAARIAEQKLEPKPEDPRSREGKEAIDRSNLYERDLISQVIPFVEKNYRVLSDRRSRAVGGFSRGGGQTLRAGFGNLDKFSWICCYSAYLSEDEMKGRFKIVYENPGKTNREISLLWVSVGKDDFLYKQTAEFIDLLKLKHVNHKTMITDGGHTWMNVKKYFIETAQLLFK